MGIEVVTGAFYNEYDEFAAALLRECAASDIIAPGIVSSASIKDLTPDDVKQFTQAHFFAGAGLWSVAARLAGWSDDRPLWTGSCPCQPFSQAGKGLGVDDPRHLWPDFFRLIRACRPPVVVGEQVAGAAGYGWLDGVRADLEGEGYACRAIDIPACAVDAPHIRNRIYWVAVAQPDQLDGRGGAGGGDRSQTGDAHGPIAVADNQRARLERHGRRIVRETEWTVKVGPNAHANAGSLLADANGDGCGAGKRNNPATRYRHPVGAAHGRNGSYWSDHEWIACHDGKARRIPRRSQSGVRHVVDGVPGEFAECDPSRLLVPAFKGRQQAWKIAGNAIVPQVAAQVLGALMDVLK
jgi:DNA (cytosine-5)-methyltransferase 1